MTGRTPGMVAGFAFEFCHVFTFAKPDFFVPHFAGAFLLRDKAAQKGRR
jgi:hypothetical protein